jgi:hypothetical protein
VWFSDTPLDANEGAEGDTTLVIDVLEREIEEYEWIEDGDHHREWLIPAQLVNHYGPPTIVGAE